MDRASIIEKIQQDIKTSNEGYTKQIIKHIKDLYDSGKTEKRVVDIDERTVDSAELNKGDVIVVASKKHLLGLAATQQAVVSPNPPLAATNTLPALVSSPLISSNSSHTIPANSATNGNVPSMAPPSPQATITMFNTPVGTHVHVPVPGAPVPFPGVPLPLPKTRFTKQRQQQSPAEEKNIVQVSIGGFHGYPDSVIENLISKFIDPNDFLKIYRNQAYVIIEFKSEQTAHSFMYKLDSLRQEFGSSLTLRSRSKPYTVSITGFSPEKLEAARIHAKSIVGTIAEPRSNSANSVLVDFKTKEDAKTFESSDMKKVFGIEGLRAKYLDNTSSATSISALSKTRSAPIHTSSTSPSSITQPPNRNNGPSATTDGDLAGTPSAEGYVLKTKLQNVQPDLNSFYTSIALFLAENKQLALPEFDADSIRREIAGLIVNDQNFVKFIEGMLLDLYENISLPTRVENKQTNDLKDIIERERRTDDFKAWLGILDDYAILDGQPPNDKAEARLTRWNILKSAASSFSRRRESLPSDSMSKLCQIISNNVRVGQHPAIAFERKVMNKFLQDRLGTDMFTITMNINENQLSILQALSKQLKRYRFNFQQAICIIQEQESEKSDVYDIVVFERGDTHTLSITSGELKQIKTLKDGDEDLFIDPASSSHANTEDVKTTEAILNTLFGKLQVESPPLDLVCKKTLELVATLKEANDQNKARIRDTGKLLKDKKDLYPVLTKMTFDIVLSDTKGLKLISWSVWACKELLTQQEYTVFLEYCRNQQPKIMDNLKNKVDIKMTMVVHNYLCLMGCLCMFENPKDLTFSECLTFLMNITETEAPENLKDSCLKGICTCLKVLTGPALIHLYKSKKVLLFEQLTRLCVICNRSGVAVKTFFEKMLEALLNKNHKITNDSKREADLAVIPRGYREEKEIEFPVCATVEARELVDWLQNKPHAWLLAWSDSVQRAKDIDKDVKDIMHKPSDQGAGENTAGSQDQTVVQEDTAQILKRTSNSATGLPYKNVMQEENSKVQDADSTGVTLPVREIPLENMGNSCFMNAALQMIYRLMRKCPNVKPKVVQNSLQIEEDIAIQNEFIRLAQEMNHKDPEYEELESLYNGIQERFHTSWDTEISFEVNKFSQRDVSELLLKIFNESRLAHCANITIRKWSKCEYDNNESSQWMQNVPESTSILDFDPIRGEAVKFILSEMVDDYFREERMTHDNNFEMCEIDGLHTKTITRRNSCTAATDTIILQLPRFVNNGQNTGKSLFEIDIDDFQIPVTVSTDLNSATIKLLYRPIGFIAHKGNTLRRAHYTYFAREESTSSWIELNDDKTIAHNDISTDISKAIYIIMCERVKIP